MEAKAFMICGSTVIVILQFLLRPSIRYAPEKDRR